MAENLQEKLDQRIQKNEKVTASEVADAYSQTVENRRKEYIANGGKYENFDTEEKAFLDGAKQLRDKQLERAAALSASIEQKKAEIIDVTKSAERSAKYMAARAYGWKKTDPDAPEADDLGIPDYDGTGKDDRLGFGRKALAGYLVALQFHDPSAAVQAFAKARDIYDKTSSWGDHWLPDKSIRSEIIGQNYLDQFAQFDLATECQGLLAGYLKLSESSIKNPQEKDAYRQYLMSKVGELAKSGSMDYTPKKGEDKLDADDNKATVQLNALEALLTAKEWQEQLAALRGSFEGFKKSCDAIVNVYPDFKFQDQKISDVLNKTPENINLQDKALLDAAREQAAKEFLGYVQKKKEAISGEIEDNKKKINSLKDANKALQMGPVSDEDWKSVDNAIDQLGKDLDGVVFVTGLSFEDLSAKSTKLQMSRDANSLMKAKIDDIEKRVKDTQEKEPKILKFLGEKNLTESFDPATKQFNYAIGDLRFSVEGGKAVWSYANPEIQKTFEAKVIPYFTRLVSKYPLTKEEKAHVDEIMGKADKKDPKSVQAATAEVNNYIAETLKTKMKQDDLDKYNKILGLMQQASKDSMFSFDHRPSQEELQAAYTQKFVPPWDKAASDFESQVAPLAVSPGGPGGETPGEVVPVKAPDDPYLNEWNNGAFVPLGEDFKGYTGGLNVVGPDGVNLRDLNTHKPVMTLPQETGLPSSTGADNTELTLSEPNADGWKVGSLTFVKVTYRGVVYYAAKERLQRNDQMPKVQPAPTPAVPEVVAPKNVIEVAGYPYKVNAEYRTALERIAQLGDTAEGVKFNIWYNKKTVECGVRKIAPQSYLIEFPGGTLPAKSLVDAMNAVNGGFIVQTMAYNDIRTPKNYEAYEDLIDEFNKKPSVSPQGEVFFELDWKGTSRIDNAEVWANATPYGGIQFRIHRKHVGIQGEDDRYGFAHNFDDFMKQVAHIKDWAENYESRRDDKKLTRTVMANETFMAQFTDPRNFYSFEQQIGRPVSFDIGANGVVQMYLDWGGGPARDIMNNAMLNVWAENGKLMFTLNAKGKGFVAGRQVANSMQELIQAVTEARSAALGGTPTVSPNLPSAVPNAPTAAPIAVPQGAPPPPKETSEQKEERNRLADGVKKKLLLLTEDDAKLEASGISVSKLLDESAALLQELKSKYPNDPDIFILGKAYEDLRRDFNEHRETNLDQAFEPILKEMRAEIAKAGVRKISMDHLQEIQSPSLLRTVERLKGLNINPSYVVQCNNPNAKTVVLFMQTHPMPKVQVSEVKIGESSADEKFAEAIEHPDRGFKTMEASQAQIRDAIIAAARAGLIRRTYEEGLPKGDVVKKLPQVTQDKLPAFLEKMRREGQPELAKVFESGSLQAKLVLGDSLDLQGYDFDELKMQILHNKADFIYRVHAHNAFIASNISDYVEASPDEVSFLTIGAMHEAYPNSKIEHHLPLSHAMAYYGMNVVVVDATYNPPVS